MAEQDPNYEHTHFQTADDLIRALAPVCCLDTKTVNPNFVFRGHGDVSWELVPKALRIDKVTGVTEALTHVEPMLRMTADDQVFAEFLLLRAFMEACDRAVIALPGDSHEFREEWMQHDRGRMANFSKNPKAWPYKQQLALLAFAQHHGVPTRLLDWTRSGVVAAYFAAEASWKQNLTRDLAIWVLNIEYASSFPQMEIVEMPGANSARLGAQRGLFTCVRPDAGRDEPIGDCSLDRALTGPYVDPTKPKPLWLLTLPASERVRLLYLCHLHGVDGSTVYPGPAGAAAATLERAAWLRKNPDTGTSADELRPVTTLRISSQRATP